MQHQQPKVAVLARQPQPEPLIARLVAHIDVESVMAFLAIAALWAIIALLAWQSAQ